MTTEHIISTFALWSEQIKLRIKNCAVNAGEETEFDLLLLKAYHHNNWFTKENILLALNNICDEFLQKEKLENWMKEYSPFTNHRSCVVGITMAGNLPLVGFHDLLCVLITNHTAMIKLSSKDNVLLPYLLTILFEIEPELKKRIIISEMLKGADAYIATGSNNSARYFETYFGKYPNIIRKNRTSVAVLDGSETEDELLLLAKDVFTYFGLGCRNVSKLFLSKNVDLQKTLRVFEQYNYLADCVKYKNNYDYQLTILLMNKTPCLANECLIVTENKNLHSPISVLYYEISENLDETIMNLNKDEIQCIVGKNHIPFGESQKPGLSDYADNIDTMKWLLELS